MVRMRSGRLAIGFAALLLGLMAAVQFRLQRVVPPPTQTSQLLSLLRSADQRRNVLTREVVKLDQQLNHKLSEAAAAKALKSQLVQAEILAGTIPVTGPGIEVTWANGSATSGYHISDIDLLLLVNELRAAGAEAISINGQRVTADTEIRQAGNYILINSAQEGPPFTILAIGAPRTLTDALTLPGGLYDLSQQEGRQMRIQKRGSVTIAAAPAPLVQYAKPAQN